MLSTRELNSNEQEKFGVFGRIHEASSLPIGRRPGVILVHGRAGNETLMWVFSRVIEEFNPIVIAPRALVEDEIGGFSWWNVGQPANQIRSISPRETKVSQIDPAIKVLSNMALLMPEMYGVDPKKLFIIGFSQGGAAAISASLENPGLFAGVGMLASFIPRVIQNEHFNIARVQLPVFVSHGTKDEIIPFERAEETVEFLNHLGANVSFNKDEVAHKISSKGLRAFKEWLKEHLNTSQDEE